MSVGLFNLNIAVYLRVRFGDAPLINVEDVDDVANIIVPPLIYSPHHIFYHRGTFYFASFPTFPSSFISFRMITIVPFARRLISRCIRSAIATISFDSYTSSN